MSIRPHARPREFVLGIVPLLATAIMLWPARAAEAQSLEELQVNTVSAGQQWEPNVAMAPDGSFVVTWTSVNGIFAKVFRPNRLSASPDIQISQTGASLYRYPSVGTDNSGRFVVTWVERTSNTWRLKARRYAAFGQTCQVGTTPTSPEIVVAQRPDAPSVTFDMSFTGLGVAPDGKFVVTWIEQQFPGEDEAKFRIYDTGDTPIATTTEQLVPRFHVGQLRFASDPQAASASWGFLLTWIDDGATFGQILGDLVARRYDWNGQSLDVNTTLIDTRVEQGGTAVATTPDETVLIAYRRRADQPTTDNNVYLLHYGSTGPLHTPIQVNPGFYNFGAKTFNTGVGVAVSNTQPWDAVVVWNLKETINGTREDTVFARHYLEDTIPASSTPDAAQLDTNSGFAEFLWGQNSAVMVNQGEFRAVWWGGPLGSSGEVFLRCGKYTSIGEYAHQRCEHDTDLDGVADRYDVDPDIPSVGYDLDQDLVSDEYICGLTQQDCADSCASLFPGDQASIDNCINTSCREDNCIDLADSACEPTKACVDQNRENCFDSSSCGILFANPSQEDQNGNGTGDLCEAQPDADEPPPLLYRGEEVDQSHTPLSLTGTEGKLTVDDLQIVPEPFRPPQEQAELQLDLQALQLPGSPSGQFEFNATVTWHIESFSDEVGVRTIVQQLPLDQVGTYPVTLAWDGDDTLGTPLPAGTYANRVHVQLVRTKTKNGKTKVKVIDELESPWVLGTLDRGNYATDNDKASLLAVSIKDPAGAPNVSIRIIRGPTDLVRLVYGEDFRIPLGSIGCTAGAVAQKALCFLEHFGDLFGLDNAAQQLSLVTDQPALGAGTAFVFKQTFAGFDVVGHQVSVRVTSALEVTQVYSTLAVPISGPSQTDIQAAHAQFDPGAAIAAVRAAAGNPDLTTVSTANVVHAVLTNGSYVAVPAVAMGTSLPGASNLEVGALVDPTTSQVIKHRRLVAEYPDMRMHTTGLHPGMTGQSDHAECTSDADCPAAQPHCSDHFSTKLCVRQCASDADCLASLGWRCFDPGLSANARLPGYCYFAYGDGACPGGQFDITLYDRVSGGNPTWYNDVLATNNAFSVVAETFESLVDYHFLDLGIDGWDNMGGRYEIVMNANCGCQCAQTCVAYNGCPSPAIASARVVTFAPLVLAPLIFLMDWAFIWTTPGPLFDWQRQHIMGHEWGHGLQGSPYLNMSGVSRAPNADTCLLEGIGDQFGSLFAPKRLGASFTFLSTLGVEYDPYVDQPYGLQPPPAILDDSSAFSGHGPARKLGYALRSRFDWLDCNVANQVTGPACQGDEDCPAYRLCRFGQCTNAPGLYENNDMFRRLVKIMAEGPGPFAARVGPGVQEDLAIVDNPMGIDVSNQIIYEAARQTYSETTLKDWTEFLLFAAIDLDVGGFGWHARTRDALGAVGFFPSEEQITDHTTRLSPFAIHFNGWTQSSNQRFTFWTDSATTEIRYQFHIGVSPKIGTIPGKTDSRPAAVEYRDFLHVFYRDKVDGILRVFLIHRSGFTDGPFKFDLATDQFAPNGAIGATVLDDRVYLFFGDADNGDKLSMAFCIHPVGCWPDFPWQRWKDFGGGQRHKAIWVEVQEGPAAVTASNINGLDPDDIESLWVAVTKTDRTIHVLNLDDLNQVAKVYSMPDHYPSHTTTRPLDIAVRNSAFHQICTQGPCPRNYLYLVWKDANSAQIFTSVLQNAKPGRSRFTRSVEALYEARDGTGVSWVRGLPATEYLQAVFSKDDPLVLGTIWEFQGFGRY